MYLIIFTNTNGIKTLERETEAEAKTLASQLLGSNGAISVLVEHFDGTTMAVVFKQSKTFKQVN